MTEGLDRIFGKAKMFVMDLLERDLSPIYLFHSQKHTLNVLHNAEVISAQSDLSEEELYLLRISALFHDVGYVRQQEDHEAVSAEIASEFLTLNQVQSYYIQQVVGSILATKIPQQPQDKISAILCDADLMHLTFDDYFEHIEPMRLEWERSGKGSFTRDQFHRKSLDFFSSHHYHTLYGKAVLAPKKEIVRCRIMRQLLS